MTKPSPNALVPKLRLGHPRPRSSSFAPRRGLLAKLELRGRAVPSWSLGLRVCVHFARHSPNRHSKKRCLPATDECRRQADEKKQGCGFRSSAPDEARVHSWNREDLDEAFLE